MNPTLNTAQSLLINETTNESNLQALRTSCEAYMLPQAVADKIIEEIVLAIKDWQSLATRLGISQREQAYFADRFEASLE